MSSHQSNLETGNKWLYLSDEAERIATESGELLEPEVYLDHETQDLEAELVEVMDFTPPEDRISQQENQRQGIKEAFDQCVNSLMSKIEEQAFLLTEKDKEIEELKLNMKLLPDLEKQLKEKENNSRLDYFENQALKKQIDLLNSEKDTRDKITRITKTILSEVKNASQDKDRELKAAEEMKAKVTQLTEELASLKRPWWKRLFS